MLYKQDQVTGISKCKAHTSTLMCENTQKKRGDFEV